MDRQRGTRPVSPVLVAIFSMSSVSTPLLLAPKSDILGPKNVHILDLVIPLEGRGFQEIIPREKEQYSLQIFLNNSQKNTSGLNTKSREMVRLILL